MSKAAVIIPTYTRSLSHNEEISLAQARKVLKNYDIYFILPESLEINYGCTEIKEKRYPDEFFSSLRKYSRFMLCPELYRDFKAYEYILVYQLDAFVFTDPIKRFGSLGYDYIGAPWIDGVFFKNEERQDLWYVGNGGLSLRNVQSFLKFIEKGRFQPYIDFVNEDVLIAAYGAPELRIAPIEAALEFSFEYFDRCMKLTEGKFPAGCHGWRKYDAEKWKTCIEEQGYTVDDSDKRDFQEVDRTEERRLLSLMNLNEEQFRKGLFLPEIASDGVYIWGAGVWGISLLHKFHEIGIKVNGFIDSDVNKCKKRIDGYKIENPHILKDQKKNVIVANKRSCEKIVIQLQEYGYEKKRNYITLQDIIAG